MSNLTTLALGLLAAAQRMTPEQQARMKMVAGIIALVAGVLAILTGVIFIRRKQADVTGKPGLTLLRGSSMFEGDQAVKVGVIRIGVGVGFLILGLILLVT